jgi:hypothetical protein
VAKNIKVLKVRAGIDRRATEFYRNNITFYYLSGFKGWLAKFLLGKKLRDIVVASYGVGWEYGCRINIEKYERKHNKR